ncbi:MAG: TIGR04086 family membrane protein [Clostridiales bacterium]|nr:TIGR04086 family membrane protein [Clostridiales bacterium]
MAQQAAKRIRRTHSSSPSLLKGIGVAIAVTLVAVIIFALIIGLTDLPDGVIQAVNQLIKIGAIFLGVRAGVAKGAENALRSGALIGVIYMGVGVLLYALLSGQQLSFLSYLIDLLMGLAVGGLSGMLIGNMQSK